MTAHTPETPTSAKSSRVERTLTDGRDGRAPGLAITGAPEPYYSDDLVTLYHGDFRTAPSIVADLVIADPPYGETSLDWDHWPTAWPRSMAVVTKSMWCFGSMRMFLDRHDQFTDWRLSGSSRRSVAMRGVSKCLSRGPLSVPLDFY